MKTSEAEKNKTARPEISDALKESAQTLALIQDEVGKVIVGQEEMVRALLTGLLTGGHILLEGLPGLAKTLAVRTLADVLDAKFQRIQFTPDLLPSDLIGTMIYHEETKEFVPKKGPIFANIVLADEINRAPAKVQSALLEAMGENQVTIGDTTYLLEKPFLVLATQNPIEQEGTYNLPEAQLDRFLFKIRVQYPNRDEERQILERMGSTKVPSTKNVFSTKGFLKMREHLDEIYTDERIKEYILRIVLATRKKEALSENEANPEKLRDLRAQIQIGASPRATLGLSRASQANALMEQRGYVIPDDIKTIAKDVLRHRLILTFEAEAKNVSTDDVVTALLETVSVP